MRGFRASLFAKRAFANLDEQDSSPNERLSDL